MSLNYNFQRIDKFRTVCLGVPWEEANEAQQAWGWYKVPGDPVAYTVLPPTHGIIWACLLTGIGEIKMSNIPEFWSRYVTWNALKGYDNGFTLDDLRRHVGLMTNVGREETRPAWRKRIIDSHMNEIKAIARRELENAG